jgi:phenylacetate-CoA ligase
VLTQVRAIDEITVEVEANAEVAVGVAEGLVPRLAEALADAHEGLRFNVELVREGTLPIFELKARRLVDRRGEK